MKKTLHTCVGAVLISLSTVSCQSDAPESEINSNSHPMTPLPGRILTNDAGQVLMVWTNAAGDEQQTPVKLLSIDEALKKRDFEP